jgi:hypothetical protein
MFVGFLLILEFEGLTGLLTNYQHNLSYQNNSAIVEESRQCIFSFSFFEAVF